jgi:hypothetical protein
MNGAALQSLTSGGELERCLFDADKHRSTKKRVFEAVKKKKK